MSPNISTAEKQINEREINLAQKTLTLITIKFVSMWLFFMVIIFGIAMLTDIDWSRPYLERSMAEATHRQVKLGHLTWTFGLGGLAIDTTRITISEKGGQPFLNAKASEIGIAFWRLLSGELRIRHLYFRNPDLCCIRYAPGIWNFDDLLKTAINVDYLECDQGTIHILDAAKNHAVSEFSPINLTAFKLKFVRPTARSNHPIFVSCTLPRDGFQSGIKLTGFVRGGSEHWQQNRTQVKLQLTKFDPSDLMPVAAILNIDLRKIISPVTAHRLAGLFDFDLDCKGVLSNKFEGTAIIKGTDVSTTEVNLGVLKAPHMVCKTKFKADKDTLAWKSTEITLPDYNLEIRSDGTVTNWRSTGDTSFNGSATANCENLSTLKKLADQSSSSNTKKLTVLRYLQGKALVELTFSGNQTQTVYKSKLRLSNLDVNNLKAMLPEEYLPLTLLLGLSGSSSQARMSGNISIDSHNFISLEDCTIIDGATTYKVSGAFDPKVSAAQCSFSIKDLSLNKISASVNQSSELRGKLAKILALTTQSQFSFIGKADCQGQFSQVQNNLTYKTDVNLTGADLSISSPQLLLKNVCGHFVCANNKLILSDFVATVDNGKMEVSGFLPASVDNVSAQTLQLHLHGSHFDLTHLATLLALFKIDSPFFAHHQLRGLVKDIVLDLDGSASKPNLKFVTLPEELYYQPPGLSHPLKAVSGTITFNHERLDLKDVGFAVNSGTVVANLSILNLLNDARLDKFKFKSNGVDLKEVCYYFNSPLLPPALRAPLVNLSRCCQLTFNSGKAYGNIGGSVNGDKVELDGLLGLINANVRLAGCKEHLEHMNGVFILSGDKLLVQDVSAVVHGSNFRLDGRISKYQDANPHWHGELTANIDSPELATFLPEICPQLRTDKVKLSAASKITLKAKGRGGGNSTSISFSLNSDPQGRFSISSPTFALHQPPAESLTIEGTVKLEPSLVNLDDLRLSVGNAVVLAKGSLQQQANAVEPEINFLVRVPDYVPTATLVQLLSASEQNPLESGRLKGFITAAGRLFHPTIGSELYFHKVCLPDFHICNLTGQLVTDPPEAGNPSSKIKARLNFASATIGNASFSNLTANVESTRTQERRARPIIVVKDCHAKFAGGKFNLDGSVDLSAKKICLRTSLNQAEADQALSDLFGFKDEITGTLSLDAVLGANFNNDRNSGEVLTNVDGSGEIKIANGNVTSFSRLQTRITQGKLLHQGLFGFNVNNLFQSVIPVKSGNFRELSTSLHFDGSLISIDSLEYDGDDLHLTASGKANLGLHTVELEIIGKVPRVSNSFIGGPMGEISKEFTVQRVIDSLTLHKLESLPSLPILGNVASAGPRQFTFKILAPYDQPKLVAHSIEKSFRWTEDRPLAAVGP